MRTAALGVGTLETKEEEKAKSQGYTMTVFGVDEVFVFF